MPSVEVVCAWAFCYATGDAKKGGDREYCNMPWYGTVSGERQSERLMPWARKKNHIHKARVSNREVRLEFVSSNNRVQDGAQADHAQRHVQQRATLALAVVVSL